MNIGANKHVSQVLCVLNSHPPDKTKYKQAGIFFFSMNTIILLYINFTDIDRINGNTSRSLS